MLTREQILSTNDLPSEPVQVPEWGGEVHVRTMTAKERDVFDIHQMELRDAGSSHLDNLRSRLAVQTVVDAEGNRLFKDEDADMLGRKSALAVGRIFEVSARLNGMTKADVEELTKNSDSGQTGVSPTV